MKKTNILKIFMTLVLAFAFSGAFAQILGAGEAADYEDATTVPVISYMTEGTTMPLWVMPDDLYQPGYDPETDDATATGHTWTWTPGAGIALGSDDNDNYVTITPAVTGVQTDYTVNVKENLPLAMGGCGDATGTDITIRSVLAPEMGSVDNYPYFNVTLGIADAGTYTQCGDMAAADVTVNLTGYPNFQLKWTLTQIQIDADGNDVGVAASIVDNSTGQILGAGNSLTRVVDQDYVLHNYAHEMIVVGTDPVRTKYVYTLGGITDNVSRKSDYLAAGTTWYDDVNEVYTIILNPAPSTGPIYHIPNNYGNL